MAKRPSQNCLARRSGSRICAEYLPLRGCRYTPRNPDLAAALFFLFFSASPGASPSQETRRSGASPSSPCWLELVTAAASSALAASSVAVQSQICAPQFPLGVPCTPKSPDRNLDRPFVTAAAGCLKLVFAAAPCSLMAAASYALAASPADWCSPGSLICAVYFPGRLRCTPLNRDEEPGQAVASPPLETGVDATRFFLLAVTEATQVRAWGCAAGATAQGPNFLGAPNFRAQSRCNEPIHPAVRTAGLSRGGARCHDQSGTLESRSRSARTTTRRLL